MANYYSAGRTNHFRVKDEDKFRSALNEITRGSSDMIDVYEGTLERNNGTYFCLLFPEGIPSYFYDEEEGTESEVDMEDFIAEHLADGCVCTMMETGAEKLRYVSGWAVTFNNKGERRVISLETINDLAKELGEEATNCSY